MSCNTIASRRILSGGLLAVIMSFLVGPADAEPLYPQNPTITLPCGAIYYRRASIFGSGSFLGNLPAVDFDFWVWAPGPCDVYGVKVIWVYEIASKATQQTVKNVAGTQTYSVLYAGQNVQHLTLHCVPTSAKNYCRYARAQLIAGKFPNPPYVSGNPIATIGPLSP
jgi:hypothetical protein